MKKLLLIDGNSILFKAFYATSVVGNLMVNKDGIPTNAVYGFINMLTKLLATKPDYIYVAFDAHRKTFRNELMEDYKGTRKETPEELVVQFSIVREYLTAANIPYYELDGYEADDLIGTMARIGKEQGLEVQIVTGDKDMLQLVEENVTVYRLGKGVSEMNEMNVEAIKEKFGLEPKQIKDLLGLMGDTADNIPGIKGVGEKTATKLLTQYGSVEGLKEHMHEIKGKMGEKIRENIEMGILSKKIATILTDVDIDDCMEHYVYKPYDYAILSSFYRKYDMNSLLRRLVAPVNKEEKEMVYNVVTKSSPVLKDSSLVVVNYDDNYHRSIILGYAIYNDEQSFYIEYENVLEDDNFKAYLKDENMHKYGFDIKKDILVSKWNGIEVQGYVDDLKLAAYVIDPKHNGELKDIALSFDYANEIYYEEEIFGKGAKKAIPEASKVAKHAILKAKAIYDLRKDMLNTISSNQQENLYDLEKNVTFILADMEFTGTKLDLNVLKQLEIDFTNKASMLEEEIYTLANEKFNIASPKQLGEVLFEHMNLPNGKKTKTGYSTAVDVLEKLIPVHPIIQKILDYRAITKLDSTYVKGLQLRIFNDGKIHTIYNQALTQTGRLSSVDPNLQNISVKSEEGRMIRKAFVPSFDYLLSYDYSQIELRVLASLANVKELIVAFNEGKDIHAHTASVIFNVPIDEVTSTQRRFAKAVNFGIIYGMSDYGLSEQIGTSIQEAKAFIEKYYESYPEIRNYMDHLIHECKQNGYVETILHRRRYIQEINDKNFMKRELGKRLAMNSPIQGSGADIIKLAMVACDKLMKQHQVKSKMILQVHDELIFDVYADELELMQSIIKQGMQEAYKMEVALVVEGNYGKSWSELK